MGFYRRLIASEQEMTTPASRGWNALRPAAQLLRAIWEIFWNRRGSRRTVSISPPLFALQ
jgi:hypothetical protein